MHGHEISVMVYPQEEESYRKAAKLINDTVNTYYNLLADRGKSDVDVLYAALLDISVRYSKEALRNDTAPFNDILVKLNSEIEDVLKK